VDERWVVGAAILREVRGTGPTKVLAARRTSPPEAAGRWELPGGKVEAGEEPAEALVREVREELGCTIVVPHWLEGLVEVRPGLRLAVGVAELVAGQPVATEHSELRWLGPDELHQVDWLDPDRPFLPALHQLLVGPR
jgi:8-oxo-dGTP diphosphatase